MNRLKRLWGNLRASFWFVPSLILTLSIAFALALKALSPGINDITTAVMGVDDLTAILSQLAIRDIPSSHRYEDGELRVVTIGPIFASLVAESFDQIRRCAEGNLPVLLKMLGALQTIGAQTDEMNRRQTLAGQLGFIAEMGDQSIVSTHDRARLNERLSGVRGLLRAQLVPAP